MQFDLVSPERRLASMQATEVQIPGADGDLTAMEGHAPAITTLRHGILKVVAGSGTTSYVVTGGFAEITSVGVSVLAERAVPVAEANAALFDGLMADARESVAAGMDKDVADKLLADMQSLRVAAGQ